jgi:beta-galactosidase
MGILCDPDHPALDGFPTDFHSDWQWKALLDQSEALVMDITPAAFRPIIQFVPDFNSNQKMSALFEARVGKGRLMVCNIDLLNNPLKSQLADQLLKSIISYMQSIQFQPFQSLDMAVVDELLKTIAPVENQSDEPDTSDAVLNVRASAKSPVGVFEIWDKEHQMDEVITRKCGFDYHVEGRYWRDASHAAWFERHLVVNVSCPADFEGSFYVHLHDIDSSGRAAALFFCGRDRGPLPRYDGNGVWLKFPVSREMASGGELVFDARAIEGPNVTISQIILIPECPGE